VNSNSKCTRTLGHTIYLFFWCHLYLRFHGEAANSNQRQSTLIEEYQYGPNGTRTYEMNSLRDIAGRTFGYSDENHLFTADTTTYQYNVDGFLTTKTQATDVTTYDYSSRGELLSVMLPDGRVIEYIHDPLGRRIAKKVDGVIVEKYLWQGLTRLLAVYDGSDNLLQRFEYTDGRMPVVMTSGGSTYYLTYDQVGSLRVVADASGNVVKRVDYDSFGNIIVDTNPSFEVPFGFAGGLHDRDTGLVRFGYRDYDPDVGRWTAKDPIFFDGGDTDLYRYCLNNPITLTDPLGLWGVRIGGSLIGADFSTAIYDSNKGWFPDTVTDLGFSTTAFGGGMQITFDNDPCESYSSRDEDMLVSMGLGKYLGVSYNPQLTRGAVNIGLGLGLPVTFSTSIENVATKLGESIGNYFK